MAGGSRGNEESNSSILLMLLLIMAVIFTLLTEAIEGSKTNFPEITIKAEDTTGTIVITTLTDSSDEDNETIVNSSVNSKCNQYKY